MLTPFWTIVALAMAAEPAWQRLGIAGVSAEFPGQVQTVPWDDGGTVFAESSLGSGAWSSYSIRAGSGESADGFTLDHPEWAVRRAGTVTLCGQSVVLWEASAAGADIVCIEYADGRSSSSGYSQPGTAFFAAFEHQGRPVRVTWTARTPEPATEQTSRERFFGSVRCEL